MKIDLIIIGNELLNGKITETNGNTIGKYLNSKGYSLNSINIVPDQEEKIIETINYLKAPQTLIITTGGLGPTLDDKTKNALANCFNKELVLNEKAIEIVKKNYARKDKEWTTDTNNYHMLPKDFIPLTNPNGHAPGFKYKEESFTIISMPGVPQELKGMLFLIDEELRGASTKKEICFKTREIPEEDIFFKLCPELWERLSQYGDVSSLPSGGMVKIYVKANQEHEKEIINYVMSTKLAPYIWQIGDESLYEFTFKELNNRGLTLAFAESCTGGLASSLMTDIAGSSSVLKGSVVSYSNFAKENVLGVKEATIEKFGVVSEEVAIEMACGAREKLQTDIAISFTGYAGPTGGTDDKPVGTACIGFSTENQSGAREVRFSGDRVFLKQKFANYGYYKIIDLLEDLKC